MLRVVRRRIVWVVAGVIVGAVLVTAGYRFGPTTSGGVGAMFAGLSVVLGWIALVLAAFMVVVPALLPHR